MRILHISDFHFEDKNLLEYTGKRPNSGSL